MRILMIASWYPDANNPMIGRFFQERARAWARNGCDVSVAVANVRLRMGKEPGGITVQNNQGVKEYIYQKRNLTPFWEEGIALQQIGMIRKIYEQVCREGGKPDLIHLESARLAYAAVKLAQTEGIPLTYMEHYSGILNSTEGTFLYRSMRKAVDGADHTFLISTVLKNKLLPVEEKCSMLPNSIDFDQFSLSQPAEPFTFHALGGLRRIKGFDLLLRAFAAVKEAFPDTRLIIGGDGEEKEALLKLRAELGLESAVTFAGGIHPNNRGAFYHGASAFVCSSRTETFSVVTVEAFASGLPVVATRCGGPEDLVDETNGILVDKEDASALAEGMKRMIQTRHSFSSVQIRDNARIRFSEESVVGDQLSHFRRIIEQSKH